MSSRMCAKLLEETVRKSTESLQLLKIDMLVLRYGLFIADWCWLVFLEFQASSMSLDVRSLGATGV